jgi:hypothetical protein
MGPFIPIHSPQPASAVPPTDNPAGREPARIKKLKINGIVFFIRPPDERL